ncbi:uncharacterized protein LOC134222219 [Armigeres subalbatus]|uniref:uncharacterized protein LOC134222219 n=1 Tax=Armigeres subalbatus TaxID=124917 RepID=UPI002ED21AF8
MMLGNTDLIDMGIKTGPRMVILKIIENLKTFNNEDGNKENQAELSSMQICRSNLEMNNKFRLNVLLPILDQGHMPNDNDLRFLNRVACEPFETRIRSGGKYPTTDEQEQLANDIVQLFPQLKCNASRPQGAPEAVSKYAI